MELNLLFITILLCMTRTSYLDKEYRTRGKMEDENGTYIYWSIYLKYFISIFLKLLSEFLTISIILFILVAPSGAIRDQNGYLSYANKRFLDPDQQKAKREKATEENYDER